MTLFQEFIENFGGWSIAEDCKIKDWPFISDIKEFLDNAEGDKMMNSSTQIIPIHPSSRYILLITSPETIQPETVQILKEHLEDWWRGEDKFFMLSVGGHEMQIRLERIEEVRV